MSYCTQTDILDRLDEDVLVQLTDADGVGEIDTNKVAGAISDADATIDSYCQARYTVPLDPVPDKIVQLSVDISIYNLYSLKSDAMPEVRASRQKEAIRFLEKVAEGKISLGAATPAPTSTPDTVDLESNTRVFTRDKMSGF